MLDEALLKLKIKNIINHVKMSRRLKKREVKYISERLREIDIEVMEAFVVKEVDILKTLMQSYGIRKCDSTTDGLKYTGV